MTTIRKLTRGEQACMIVTAALPWYGMFSGSFLLYVFVLMAAARLGYAALAASWVGIIPLALLLLFVNPTLLIAAVAGNGSLPRPALWAALAGTAVTLTFGAAYAGLSAAIAVRNAGMLGGTGPDIRGPDRAERGPAGGGDMVRLGVRKDPLALPSRGER